MTERDAPAPLDRMGVRAVRRILRGIGGDRLTLRWGGKEETFGAGTGDLSATVTVKDPRFFRRVAFGGSLGGGEAYMEGDWTADDLVAVIRILVRSQEIMRGIDRGWARLTRPARTLFHWLRRNTLAGSRRNIAEHYDLGNEFYELMLDETMAYSCGVFEKPGSTLAEASAAKFDRLCRKLSLGPDDRVLEIGTGWGGFAVHAASNWGCRVTTTTISRAQHEHAVERVRKAGLSDRVQVLTQDYRELTGRYDKLVSIEMIEAVGHHYLDEFFRVVGARLEPHGMAGIQAITVPDHLYESHVREVDFIKRYIFPGSCIPSLAAMLRSAARASDLRLVHLEDITRHYAKTLRLWRERFLSHVEEVRAMGFPERFVRMWEFYLAYCEGSFEERYNGDVQLVFAKPRCRSGLTGPPPAVGFP